MADKKVLFISGADRIPITITGDRYETIRALILKNLATKIMTFTELMYGTLQELKTRFSDATFAEVLAVKEEMESDNIIELIQDSTPHRYRISASDKLE